MNEQEQKIAKQFLDAIEADAHNNLPKLLDSYEKFLACVQSRLHIEVTAPKPI